MLIVYSSNCKLRMKKECNHQLLFKAVHCKNDLNNNEPRVIVPVGEAC